MSKHRRARGFVPRVEGNEKGLPVVTFSMRMVNGDPTVIANVKGRDVTLLKITNCGSIEPYDLRSAGVGLENVFNLTDDGYIQYDDVPF